MFRMNSYISHAFVSIDGSVVACLNTGTNQFVAPGGEAYGRSYAFLRAYALRQPRLSLGRTRRMARRHCPRGVVVMSSDWLKA